MTTKKTKTPKGTKVTREVEIDLDEKLKLKLVGELAEKSRSLTKLNTEFDEVKNKWKERIKPVQDRVETILAFIENGKEKKTVETTMVKNFEENRIEYWLDGVVVDHRPMTVTDRQEELPVKTRKGRIKEANVKTVEPTTRDEDIAQVHRLETSKRTKTSAVDGPTGNGHATNGLDGVYPEPAN